MMRIIRNGRSSLRVLATLALTAAALAGCGTGVDSQYGRAHLNRSMMSYAPALKVKPSEALDYSRKFEVHGIDVSKYQGRIDWPSVAGSGVSFAWIKATEGADHLDSRFHENWAGAKAAGVPRGAYHFAYWCRPWQEEMAWFERNVPRDPDALPPVLDVEATPKSKTCRKILDPQQTVADMRNMLQEMERFYGKRPIIYSTVDFYEAILAEGALNDYPIWVRSTKHHPSVRYGQRKWHFWQYQSDGSVPGISGYVDRNCFHGSPGEWQKWLAMN